jgi:tol-pal system protein YbgF
MALNMDFRFGTLAASLALGLMLINGKVLAQAGNNQLLYQLMNRMERLEQELRQLRGDLEVYQYRQKDVARRLEAIESGQAALGSGVGGAEGLTEAAPVGAQDVPSQVYPSVMPSTPQQNAAVAPAPSQPVVNLTLPSGTEQEAYDAAFNSLREGQYGQAISGFEGFLTAYPKSMLAANAHYWLGETYYAVRDYPKAKDTFLQLGAEYPKSDKLPEAMLKLGYVYDVLGDKDKARQVLEKLIETYPNSAAAAQAQEHLRSI